MVIRKEYNIEQLVEQLQTEIEKSKEIEKSREYNEVVKLDVLTASDILEVLKEIQKVEQGYQNLESEPIFIEKEDGTQTNIMEEETECFGHFDGNDIKCCICDDMKRCEEETNIKPDCYSTITGCYEVCERCRHNKSCVYRVRKKEDKTKQTNEPECFGEYDDEDYLGCLMCMCGDKCLKETKQRRRKTNE